MNESNQDGRMGKYIMVQYQKEKERNEVIYGIRSKNPERERGGEKS